jgi:hypothetical protein
LRRWDPYRKWHASRRAVAVESWQDNGKSMIFRRFVKSGDTPPGEKR